MRHGDVCLVRNYLEELQRWSKQQYRYEAVCQGELLATGEDADLELHHQPFPLQKKMAATKKVPCYFTCRHQLDKRKFNDYLRFAG